VVLAIVACFLYLNVGALYYDEAIYAQVSKEIVRNNKWITLHWNGALWFHKPPLYFWATALLFKVFGPSEFCARFFSAASGVGSVALTALIATYLRDRRAGFLAGLILISSALFVFNARQGTTDVTLTFFILVASYSYLRSETEPRFWLVTGLACSLAVLTKGAAGIISPAIIVLSLVFDRRLKDTGLKGFRAGVILFIALTASWHVVLILLHGRTFVDEYFFKHVLQRSTADLHSYHYGPFFYLGVFWEFVWPWVLFAPVSIFAAFRRNESRILLILAVFPLLLFSLATTKFQWYVVPVLPAYAILTALAIEDCYNWFKSPLRAIAGLVVGAFVLTGWVEVVRYCKPDPEFEIVAAVSKRASVDGGAISTCPESLEMTVLYYSDRKLCTDPVVSPLSVGSSTKCESNEIRDFIYLKQKADTVTSRFLIQPRLEESDVVYARVTGNHQSENSAR
jgi:4-amino-4-deoxy-L-arabinose transferase-like glycosyltransferase